MSFTANLYHGVRPTFNKVIILSQSLPEGQTGPKMTSTSWLRSSTIVANVPILGGTLQLSTFALTMLHHTTCRYDMYVSVTARFINRLSVITRNVTSSRHRYSVHFRKRCVST